MGFLLATNVAATIAHGAAADTPAGQFSNRMPAVRITGELDAQIEACAAAAGKGFKR